MGWTKREFSAAQVDAAGIVLLEAPSVSDLEYALQVINNWRAAHAFPLNTFQTTLRRKGKAVDKKCLVAQRVKRLVAIDEKLRRFDWLRLSEMQDIAGVRAVLQNVQGVRKLVRIYEESDLKHPLHHKDDYIINPKRSGYRGIHLIYQYRSDKNETYNDLKIEMQFRSRLQHAWATAVETVGMLMGQGLKSSQGEKAWLRFFALMGTAIALREDAPLVANTPTNRHELVDELRELCDNLQVEGRLSASLAAVNKALELKDARYFLLVIDPAARMVTVKAYKLKDLEKASAAYLDAERQLREQPGSAGSDAVLVSVDDLNALRRAYPNYFLDTRRFLNEVRRAASR